MFTTLGIQVFVLWVLEKMDQMEEMWEKLQLTKEEEAKIEILTEEVKSIREKGALCLIGNVWVDRAISKV